MMWSFIERRYVRRTPMWSRGLMGAKFNRAFAAGVLIWLLLGSSLAHAYEDARLVEAAENGDAAAVQTMLAGKADVNSRDGSGATALMKASGGGYGYVVKKLLDAGADVGVKDSEGNTALSYAIDNGQTHIGRMLLAYGARLDSEEFDNRTTALLSDLADGESGEGGQGGSGAGAEGGGTGAAGAGAAGAGAGGRGGNSQAMPFGGGGGAANADSSGGRPAGRGGGISKQTIDEVVKTGKKALEIFGIVVFCALCVLALYKMGIFSRLLSIFSREGKGRGKKLTVKKAYQEGRLAERCEKYRDAATLYEQVLSLDNEHKNARFYLAKVYHKKIGDPVQARKHYMALIKQTPTRHTYHKEAMEAMRELGGGGPADQ